MKRKVVSKASAPKVIGKPMTKPCAFAAGWIDQAEGRDDEEGRKVRWLQAPR